MRSTAAVAPERGALGGVRLLGLVAWLGACHPAPRGGAMGEREYPGELVPTSEIQGDFVLQQRVHARFQGREGGFEAVLQHQGDALTLVGMTPFHTRAFVMVQRGVQTEFTSHLPEAVPFPPRAMLLDAHRVLFMSAPGASPADGERRGVRAGEEIREVWAGGRLRERHFRRLDGRPAGSIDVEYEGGMAGREVPRTVHLRNGWYGYELTITTLSQTALPPPTAPEG